MANLFSLVRQGQAYGDTVIPRMSNEYHSGSPGARKRLMAQQIEAAEGAHGGPPGKTSPFATSKQRVIGKFKTASHMKIMLNRAAAATMEKLPDKPLLTIFSYLPHREILKCASVCKKWRTLAYDPRLWQVISLRPDYGGLHVHSLESLLALISVRFAPAMRLIELPMELVQPAVLHELANKCSKLQYLTLDFSTAVQLHEFSDLQFFPARLRSFTICLSENIFLESFIRRIYTFITTIEVLHLIGTFEKIENEEEETYEVINLHKLKAHTPNLKVVNFWGVAFMTDDHIESLSTNCAHIECLNVSYCMKFRGTSLKTFLYRCKKLRSLLMEQCVLDSKALMEAAWDKTRIEELNITGTDLSAECLASVLTRIQNIRWLSAGYSEYFADEVLEAWVESGNHKHLRALDLNYCDSLSDTMLTDFLSLVGPQLVGLNLSGIGCLVEKFWLDNLPKLKPIKILVMGVSETCCPKVKSRIHIDQFIDCMANALSAVCRLEISWDPSTLRFSEKSSKFIDILRMKCLRLHSLVLIEGEYYELVKSNFERAGQMTIVRSSNCNFTTINPLLHYFKDLSFN